MMRIWAALAVASCSWSCGDNCETRVAKLEARLTDEIAQYATLRALGYRLQDSRLEWDQQSSILPLATKPERHFAPGRAFWVGTDEAARSAFESAIAGLACEKREGPLRVYLAAPSANEREVGEYASWLAAASAAWKVPIEARRVVRLAAKEYVFPWPPNSELGQELAKEAFAVEGQPNRELMLERMKLSNFGCPAIPERAGEYGERGEPMLFILAGGLRDCGCQVVDFDTTVGIWYVSHMGRTDLGWEPVAAAASTQAVPPLACDTAKPAIVLKRTDHWTTPPAQLEQFVTHAREWIEQCRRDVSRHSARETGDIVRVSIDHSSTFSRYEMSAADDAGDFFGGCTSQTLEQTRETEYGDESLSGSTTLELFVPAGSGVAVE